MRKLLNTMESINQFKKERAILKRSTFMQEIIQMMNDDLSIEIYEDLNHSFRTGNSNILYLDITSELIEIPSEGVRKTNATGEWTDVNGTIRKWIDVPNIHIYRNNYYDSTKLSVEDLTFNDDHIVDNTGNKFYFNDMRITKRFLLYYELIDETTKRPGYLATKEFHNTMNGTLRQTQVPTLMHNEYYCSDCQKWTKITDYKSVNFFDKTITCPKCGTEHHFDDIKFVNTFDDITIYSSVFMDKNKVTFSNKTLTYGVRTNSDNKPFWTFGTHKVTINLETGYSYRILSGSESTMLKRAGINVPSFYNCTYETHRIGYASDKMAANKALKLMNKYQKHKNLVNLIDKRFYILKNLISKRTFIEVDDYMTDYYTNKFGYKVQPLINEEARNMKIGNVKFSTPAMQDLVLKNRFVNLDTNEIHLIASLMDQVRDTKRYKLMNRTAPNATDIIISYLKTNVSKKLRKDIIKLLANDEVSKRYNSHQVVRLLLYISKFTNKEYQNTAFKMLTKLEAKEKTTYDYMLETFVNTTSENFPFLRSSYCITPKELDLFFKLRDEQYICKLSMDDLCDKLETIYDCIRIIDEIRNVLGEDWNPLDLKFKTEKQYHDDLVKILNSDTVREIRISRDNNPFEMEDEIYALEDLENNIHIARVGAELAIIGQQMGICVGGYVNSVRNKHCRIAYITDPITKEYKVCLELRPVYNKDKNGKVKVTYTLNQAKLNSNQLVRSNPKYHNLITEWCDKHHIQIETRDMLLEQVKEVNELYF